MKIVGIMVCGEGEAGRYLEETLKEFKRLCDDAIIVGNKTDPRTERLIKQYGYWFYRDDREWGLEQPRIKSDLLARAGRLHPDWVIALDADERFAPEFSRLEAEKLASTDEIAYHFMVVNLYNDEQHYAHSVGIQRFWNIRYFKFMPQFTEYIWKSLHCGLAPNIFYQRGWYAPYYLLHFGLMKQKDRLRKAERYKKYDPKAIHIHKEYYEELEADLPPRPFDPQRLLRQLAEARECQPRSLYGNT